ncbi:uncharacterized protein LOC129773712 [Toxorhynchites rutilus septentrionalis]|uniref:uncharacterized protein LOC129773712 n=1 Tax=Toxorhynchites rutilus septentrionalis TaxID=329112 RepID=UPI002479BB8C|nr:uncharacterized protein LOC129773712 [Toxorhynchites rutilus septentrionalis]
MRKSALRKGALNLKTLLRRRESVIASAELIKTFDENFEVSQINQVALRIERLDELFRKFESVQDEIELIEDREEKFLDDREQFQDKYFELKASLMGKLPQTAPVLQSAPLVQTPPVHVNPTMSVKLPELRIPEFSGKPEQWIEFRDLFKAVIHSNTQLSAVQKLHYLRSSLAGDASRLISSTALTADNYPIAWKIITDRYENKNYLVKQHMTALFKTPPAKKGSAAALDELADEFNRHVRILDKLEDVNDHWNSFLVERLSSLLDGKSLLEWETQCKEEETPKYDDLLDFMHKRSRTLQKCSAFVNTPVENISKPVKGKASSSHVASESVSKCPGCKNSHPLTQCEMFQKLTPNNRFDFAKSHRLCINCLRGGHMAKECRSGLCRICGKKHHSLLHLPTVTSIPAAVSTSDEEGTSHTRIAVCATPATTSKSEVSYSGAMVPSVVPTHTLPQAIKSVSRRPLSISTSVESPPSSSPVVSYGPFESEPLPYSSHVPAASLTQSNEPHQATIFLSTAVVRVRDINGAYHYARALLDSGSQSNFVSESLAQKLGLKRSRINLPISGIGQATVSVHFKVDVMIASRFGNFEHLLDCLVLPRLTVCLPSRHVDIDLAEHFKTLLGYVVSGKAHTPTPGLVSCHLVTDQDLNDQLARMWEVDDFDVGKALTQEEREVEHHFTRNVTRSGDGRYTVRLPLRQSMLPLLGDSYSSALHRLLMIERRFAKNSSLREEYIRFMDEYVNLGHMEVVIRVAGPQFFLPHHAIHRPESSTTKTRIVFDASSKATGHLSLNEVLQTGPIVQPPLISTVINFRMPKFVFTADAEKMFRQVWIHPEDRKFQQILWRRDPSQPVQTYQLKTVTYGLTSSPYHAAAVLNKLAEDEGQKYPLAAPVVKERFYVDDVLAGGDDPGEVAETCRQLQALLAKGGFTLRKWCTNDSRVLQHIPSELWENASQIEIGQSHLTKTLGLLWDASSDCFRIKIPSLTELNGVTKRVVVSEMSQLFDPLGFLGPVVINVKMFIQELWTKCLSWDEELSDEDSNWWQNFRVELPILAKLTVPRCVLPNQQREYQLHCFSDASQRGYGSCVYVVGQNASGEIERHLLIAKSRVAPLRGLSIPRLELCAAVLGSQLVQKLRTTEFVVASATFWTDSTVVLHWIRSVSTKWKVFVSNRIAEVQGLTRGSQWRHVPTHLNPADRISRGVRPTQIQEDTLWWHGPNFLAGPKEDWPEILPNSSDIDVIQERRQIIALTSIVVDNSIFYRYAELGRLLRISAWCIRFAANCRRQKDERNFERITPHEIDSALKILVRKAQVTVFHREIIQLELQRRDSNYTVELDNKSPLKHLNVFLDINSLLRLDGRLRNASIPYDSKYPMILPADHRLSLLLARSLHLQTAHSGPSLLLATMRQRFWPLRGRQLVRKIVRYCITCFKCRPPNMHQQMAPLPAVRVVPSRVFSKAGLDYCGPFLIRPLYGRGANVKMYIAVFVCLAVKAVHFEIVPDLTSAACINAITRFVSRYGRLLELHCDNATAFVGADRELRAARARYLQQFQTNEWENYCLDSGIEFHFIPARSPHFGGLWEAGVKSFKYHFRRIFGNRSYTLDEFSTAAAHIECILNSRPLTPLTDHPDDLDVLTPGHFLIGEPMFSIPQPDVSDVNLTRLSRLQEMQRLKQDFWNKWSRDYVSQLHQRSKWKTAVTNVRKGALVLLKQDGLPPFMWNLGRVVETYVGSDGLVRVVLVRTGQGTYKRAITEVRVLPLENEGNHEHRVLGEDNGVSQPPQ